MPKISKRARSYTRRPSWSEDSTYAQVVERHLPADADRDFAEPNTWVYAVLDREAMELKIGWTSSVKRRVRQISQDRGRKVELLGAIRGSYELERLLHQRLQPFRVPGTREWYSTEVAGEVERAFSPSKQQIAIY